jgi:phosphoglycolate phosphatase-like HAD superfamily hydrolase
MTVFQEVSSDYKLQKPFMRVRIKCALDVSYTESCSPQIIAVSCVSGTGTFVRAIETCTSRKAFKIGKPSPYVCEAIIKRHKVDPEKTLMIGDRQVEV